MGLAPIVGLSQTTDQISAMTMKSWQSSSVSLTLSTHIDRFRNMSLEQLQALTIDPSILDFDFSGMQETNYAEISAVGAELSLSFAPLDRNTGTYRQDRELHIGLGILADREAMVEYRDDIEHTSTVICNVHSELNLSASYIFKSMAFGGFHPYAGVGTQLGTTVGNKTLVIHNSTDYDPEEEPIVESDDNTMSTYDAKQLFIGRAFLLAGFEADLGSRWKLGLDMRAGAGAQAARGVDVNYLMPNTAMGIRAGYRF